MTITLIIRDESPLIHLNEPITYRTVHIELTKEQIEKLKLQREEAISQIFLDKN